MLANIMKNHCMHSVLLGNWVKLPGFWISPNKCFLHHKYANKGFYKKFGLKRSFVVILWIIQVGGTWKMNIDLDCVMLSLRFFFFMSCLMDSFFHQLSGSTLIFVNNIHQKTANLVFRLILPVVKVPWWFIWVQYI